jgi:pyrroline-5-carboxylate reductase
MKIGFIGGGAMGEALVGGIVSRGVAAADDVYISDHKETRCAYLRDKYKVSAMVGADSFLSSVDILFLAIKPQAAETAIREVCEKLQKDTIVVSIVAGMKLCVLEKHFISQPVIRVMPNTPMAAGEGMSAFSLGQKASQEDGDRVERILSAAGLAVCVKEEVMDAVTGLSGSGPAYAFLMIDALADGGVAAGLPRKAAITLAAQTLLGAARMVLETGLHPDVLRDQVTSPAGTTIAGVRVMEQRGVRGALIDAVLAATEKSRAMGQCNDSEQ